MTTTGIENKGYDYLFKLLLIGNSSVGKSSLILRFVDDQWNEAFVPTIGVDFKIKTMNIDGKIVKYQIWDTAGQERFKNITASYYRGAHGILVIYDITDTDSFKNLSTWLIEIEKNANKNVYKLLIGNKSDWEDKRKISYQQGKEFADTYGMKFIETSVKNNINVSEAFELWGKDNITIMNEKGKVLGSMTKETKSIELNKKTSDLKTKKGCC